MFIHSHQMMIPLVYLKFVSFLYFPPKKNTKNNRTNIIHFWHSFLKGEKDSTYLSKITLPKKVKLSINSNE